MESSCGYSFIAHKKKDEKKRVVFPCIFPKVHCFARSSESKRIDELYERNLYRGFNYFKIAHFFFPPAITTEAFI